MRKFKIICNKCNSEENVEFYISGYEEDETIVFECHNCKNKTEYFYDEELK